MTSQALSNLNGRLKDIDQLMEAHKVLTQMQKARKIADSTDGGLSKIADVINSLVTEPGKGRRRQVEALNRSAFVLLSAHLQGFVEDLHLEAANIILVGKVNDIEKVVNQAKPRSSNPHAHIIVKMFNGIGIFEVMDGIVWQKSSNPTIRKKLTENIKVRNRIAHGDQEKISKQKVDKFRDFVVRLAEKLDENVAEKINQETGTRPW